MSRVVLVTGSEGFIGSHLVSNLVKDGYNVKALCLYNSFNDTGWLKDLDLDVLKNVEITLGDIRDLDSLKKTMKGVNIVFHLAALVAIPYSYVAPESYIDTNIKGTLNVLRLALDQNIEQVIHTSTSEVYGTAQFVPITEEHPLVGQSPYSASKIGADQLAYSFYSSYGLPVSIVRPFNAYGPRQSSRAVIPTIINQLLTGNNVLKLGNIKATRDFNFVYDTVVGMTSFLNNEKTFGDVINLGTGIESSIEEVAQLISQVARIPIEIHTDFQRFRPDKSEVERLCASNIKAKEILNWTPHYSLRQGLEITYEWFQSNAKQYNLVGSNYII